MKAIKTILRATLSFYVINGCNASVRKSQVTSRKARHLSFHEGTLSSSVFLKEEEEAISTDNTQQLRNQQEETIGDFQNHRKIKVHDKRKSSDGSSSSSSSSGSSSSSSSSGSGSESSSGSGSGSDVDNASDEASGSSTTSSDTETASVTETRTSSTNAVSASSTSTQGFISNVNFEVPKVVGQDRTATSILMATLGGLMCLVFLFSLILLATYQIYTSKTKGDDEIITNENNKAEHLMRANLEMA